MTIQITILYTTIDHVLIHLHIAIICTEWKKQLLYTTFINQNSL